MTTLSGDEILREIEAERERLDELFGKIDEIEDAIEEIRTWIGNS